MKQWKLKDESGVLDFQSIVLDRTVTIGRDKSNDIVIKNSEISRSHCKLSPKQEHIEIIDLNSTNGIFIKNEKVKRGLLQDGDTFKAGGIKFSVQQVHQVAQQKLSKSILSSSNKYFKLPWIAAGMACVFLVGVIVTYIINIKPKQREVLAPLQLTQTWSQSLPNGRHIIATPVIADINGDGYLDVSIGDSKGIVTCLDGARGKLIFGNKNELQENIFSSLVAGDITGDGKPEVIATSQNSGVAVFTYTEQEEQLVWKFFDSSLGKSLNRPILYDVSGDGIRDVIFATNKKGLVALDGTRGWKLWDAKETIGDKVIASPMVYDVNDDGHKDFIVNTIGGKLFALSGDKSKVWKLWESTNLEKSDYASPVHVNANGRSMVVVATQQKGVYAFDMKTGNSLWIKKINGKIVNTPVVFDGNGDGNDDVAVVTKTGTVYLFDGVTGNKIWQMNLNREIRSSPALFDASKDGIKDIVLADFYGNVLIIDGENGQILVEQKIANTTKVVASLLIADLTNDGMAEVLITGENGVISAYTINRRVENKKVWSVYMGNDEHGKM